MGGHHRLVVILDIFIFFLFLAVFWPYLAIFAFLGHFCIFCILSGFRKTSELWDNLRYQRGSLRGLGVFGEVWGGWGVLGWRRGGQEWSVLPLKDTFCPSLSLLQDKFGSKHHIMVQLANIYKVGITDPFLDLSGPPKGNFIAKQAILRPQIVPNLAFLPLK